MARTLDREAALRLAALVGGGTLVLTASIVGLLALAGGGSPGVSTRLPIYVLAGAVAFVAGLLLIEARYDGRADPTAIVVTAGAIAITVLVVVALSGEGVVYAAANPNRVLVSQNLLYFLAAGLVGTGLAYWGVRHWREFTDSAGTVSGSDRL